MSTFKKLLALTLALAMVLSVSAFAGSYKADTYKDAAGIDEDCEDAIELMYALDIMKGDANGNFNPTATITRAEIAKMIYVILNYGKDDKAVNYTGAKIFSDVVAGAWYEGYVNYCGTTKLVQGRGNGTFGPNDPITCAEAAKMLLTAIGYSAESRGYTGANWDKNVLSDAAIIGLLKGYKYNTNTYAPRQWVAVMFQNALENALTYNTMAPVITGGLLTSVSGGYETLTMGEKYYGFEVVEGVMTSANGYKIDGTLTAGSGEVVVDGEQFDADATIEDLGQTFKAIVIDGEAISLRNTGDAVVAEDEVKDVTYELTYATSSNNYKNVYEFTVGDLTGKLNGGKTTSTINVLDVIASNRTYESLTAEQLKAEIAKGAYRNDIVRAIDSDGDGDIDYVIYTPVEYAMITKVATSQKYGDYVKATAADGSTLTINGGSNLYIEDCILTEDELEVGNYVKFTWNMDEKMYDVEVLPVAEFVEFESRKIAKNEYTFDGETYNKAANAFTNMVNLGTSGMLGDDFDIVVDGDLLVQAVKSDDNYKSMDEVNANLAVLIKSGIRNMEDDNVPAVKLLTIDGEQNWYAYDVAKAISKANDTNILTWDDVNDSNLDGKDADWDQLVIVHTTDDGVYLETIPANEDLALPTTLVDNVTDKVDVLKVSNGTAKFGGTKLAAENEFFAKIDGKYCVVTIEDLAEGTYSGVDAQSLVKTGTYYDTIVGGYYIIDDADPSTAEGVLFILEVYEKEYADDDTTVLALTEDNEEKEITISDKSVPIAAENCYVYECTSGVYTLTKAWDGDWNTVGADEDGTLWYAKDNSVDTEDYDYFALKTTIWERNTVDGKWEVREVICEFLTADELAARIVECVEADETNNYIYNVITDSTNDILYVRIDVEMNANQY